MVCDAHSMATLGHAGLLVFGKAKFCLQAGLAAGKDANEVVDAVLEAVGEKHGEVEDIRALVAETRGALWNAVTIKSLTRSALLMSRSLGGQKGWRCPRVELEPAAGSAGFEVGSSILMEFQQSWVCAQRCGRSCLLLLRIPAASWHWPVVRLHSHPHSFPRGWGSLRRTSREMH